MKHTNTPGILSRSKTQRVKNARWASAILISSAVLGATAGAQSLTQGAIEGTVFDATNAVVPNATVTIHNNGTNADQTLTTDGAGYYKQVLLPPGVYTVTIKAAGFGDVRSGTVVVSVNEVTEVSPHLQLGAEAQVVEVTSEPPAIKFDTPAYGGQLDNREIENIPINNRRWSSLALLTPGTSNDAQGFGLIAFRAIQPQLNNVQIDGVDDNQAFYGEERGRTRAGYSTAQIAVQEFQVNTGVYSAEFGRAVGGVINSITKSGTNAFHGEAYFYHRDSQWGAQNPYTYRVAFDPTAGAATRIPFKATDKRNQYGFGVGGPLIKDKLFGFYAFDKFQRNFPGTGTAVALSFFNRLNVADAKTLATSIYNATGNPNYNPALASSIPQAQAIYNSYIGVANTSLGQQPRTGGQVINTPRLDYQLTPNNRITLLYHRLRWDSPGGVQTQANVFYARDGFAQDFVKLDYGVARLVSVVRSNITNELRYQYGRELNDESALPNTGFTSQLLTNGTGISPQVNLNNGSQGFIAGQPYYAFRPALPDERKWQVGDTAIVQLGRHAVKFGEDIVHNYDLQATTGFSGYSPNGTFNYTSILGSARDVLTRAGVVNGNSTTLGQASLNSGGGGCGTGAGATYKPLGCYSYYRQTISPTPFSTTNTGGQAYDLATVDYGFFVQDDWKATPRLTLNLGARYDYESIPDQQSQLIASNNPGSNSHISDKNNIGPRVGFAYDPYGKGETVVRGGFGMYYGRIPNVNLLSARFNSGSANGQLGYNFSSPSIAGAPLFSQRPADSTIRNSGLSPDITNISPSLKNPYTEEFDLAVQQNLGINTVLSITYLGALGRELPNSLNLNLNPANAYVANYTVTAAAGQTTCGPVACGTVLQEKVYGQRAVGQTTAATLNPAYGNIFTGVSNINSNYHALAVDVTHRAGKFITYDAAYTWSHALDYNQSEVTGFSFNGFFDPFGNGRANYGNSFLNVRHRAVGWAIFNVPGLSGHGLATYATNGWSIKPAFQMQSGLPYSANVNGTTAPSQCTAAGCLQATNSGLSGLGVSYIPQLGRNNFQYPRDILLDLRIQKDIRLSEKFNFQLLVEAFNLANHQNVTSLVSTAYNLTNGTTPATSGTAPTGTLTYQPLNATGGFGFTNSANSNFAYSPRNVQIGGRLFF